MSMKQVRFAVSRTYWLPDKDRLELRRRSRMSSRRRRMANDAIATLRGFGLLVPGKQRQETFQTIDINYRSLEEFIVEQHMEIIREHNIMEAVIVMGSAEFSELCGSMTTSPLYIPRFSEKNTFRGMSIVVLPWMTGTILVPKSYLKEI